MIIFTGLSGLSFASEEASTLYKLNLLAGDGTGFNLDGQLKRRDAAAFIVKFIGKNDFVKAKSYMYQDTGFSDVPSDMWYAPYVGYLVDQGIVNGYGDNTFKPNENVSEKAFLKMALVAMGYEYNEDFDWDNIFYHAYEKGLVEDINYTVMSEDNFSYNRGHVVSALYHALDEPINNENRTVVERLVDEDVVSYAVVNDLDLVKEDELRTKIKSIELKDSKKIALGLNETIKSYQVEVKGPDNTLVEVSETTLNDTMLTIETVEDLFKESYTVILKDVVDHENFTVSSLSKAIEGYEKPVNNSVYFEIAKIEVISNKEIEVFFTHPIDTSSELPLLYTLKENGLDFVEGSSRTIEVSSQTGNDKSLKLWLIDAELKGNTEYTLDINGDLTSRYTVYLNKGLGQELTFTGQDTPPEKLALEEIKVLNDDYLRLTFNRGLDETSALDVNNYSLDNLDSSSGDYNQAAEVKFTGSGTLAKRQVDVKFFNMNEGDEYELELDDIFDLYEYDEIVNFERAFLCDFDSSTEESELKLADAVTINEKTIQLYFDGELDEKSENAVITINGESISQKIVNPEKPYMMTLILSSNFRDNETEDIRVIDGIYDINGNKVDGVMTLENIEGSDNNIGDVKLSAVDFISEDKIKIEFSRNIDTNRSDNLSDYTLEYEDEDNDNHKITAKDIVFVYDNLAVVTFDTVETVDLYEFVVQDIFDYTGHETNQLDQTIEK